MTDSLWTDVDRYATELLVKPAEALDAAIEASGAAGLPPISVTAPLGKFLKLLAQSIGARRILEVGTLGGYSAIWFAQAVSPGGQVVTLEVDGKHASLARENIARAGLSDIVDVRLGPAAETMKTMHAERTEPFDLIFIDADKPSYPDYLQLGLSLAHVGTLIIADNVVRRGAVVDAGSTDERVRGVRAFNEAVARHPRLDATLVQTVGAKGYDGFTLARVVR
jgi:predicted O-methyltransferase YrrM